MGLLANFINKLYKKWFLKDMVSELNKGDEWMDEFTLNEIKWIAERMSKNAGEKEKKRRILKGELPTQMEIDAFTDNFKERLLNEGETRPIKVSKDEFKDIPIKVKINVAEKQKNFTGEVENIFGFMKAILSTGGQILQIPGMDDLLNQVIEYMGLNPVNFSGFIPNQPAGTGAPAPVQAPAALAPVPVG
jgi:hypothetical protein